MKKFMFILTVVLVSGISKSVAQNTLVATLTHGDKITMFYGVDAFVKAHNTAVDGDIINLSGGKFNATTITKGITIRGTGTTDANPTSFVNNIDISMPANTTDRLNIEGCSFSGGVNSYSLASAFFLKNKFINSFNIYGTTNNVTFVSCEISGNNVSNSGVSYYTYDAASIQFINCYICNFYCPQNYTAASNTFINCILVLYNNIASYISNSQLLNSILYYNSTSSWSIYCMLPATSSAWNCVAVGAGLQTVFDNLSSPQNCTYADKDIFIESKYWLDLTDEAKATYLGNDGTPVGRYGGPFPFNMTPTYPTITKMNVANRTTADGKLSVEIEVSATE